MVTDLRNQLAQALADALRDNAHPDDHADITNPADAGIDGWFDLRLVADALLARFAVAGPLPEADTHFHYPDADRWIGDQNSPIVYLAANGQIDFAGPGYWNTRKGDDPRPFAAAIIAAWRKAQEQSHARWEAGHGKR